MSIFKNFLTTRLGMVVAGISIVIVAAVVTSLFDRGGATGSGNEEITPELVESLYRQATERLEGIIEEEVQEARQTGLNAGRALLEEEGVTAARRRELLALEGVIDRAELLNAQAWGCRGGAWIASANENLKKTGEPMSRFLYGELERRQIELDEYLAQGHDLIMTAEQKEVIGDLTGEMEAISKAIQNLRRSWMVAEYEAAVAEYEAAVAEQEANGEEGSAVIVPPKPSFEIAELDCNMAIHAFSQEASDLVLQNRLTQEAEAAERRNPAALDPGDLPGGPGERGGANSFLPTMNQGGTDE